MDETDRLRDELVFALSDLLDDSPSGNLIDLMVGALSGMVTG